jgi:peptidase E
VAGTIIAMGGLSWEDAERRALEDYFLGFARRERPRVLFVPTAAAEDAEPTLLILTQLADRAEVGYVPFFPWPPENLRELALDQDVIYVSGGNTANALAIWRVHGFDAILREAWEAGVVLTGWSAGMICWFEAGVTDSFGPQLDGMRDGLGFLPGSACPHYDGEEQRRPTYRRLVGPGCSRTAGRPTTARRSCSKAKRSPRSSPRGRRRRRTASRATATVSARSACRRATSAAADRAAQPTPAGWSRRSISISPSSRSTSRGSMSPAPRRCVDSAPHATAKRRHSAGGVPR